VSDSRRDADLEETDSVQVVLDSYQDGQNGFVFGTNPAGIEYDAQVTREGTGQFGAGTGEFNLNWDTNWQVASRITESGWSAEMAIPFKSLRYAGGAEQTWGVNFQRNIRRNNEVVFWSPLERQFNLYRVSRAGRLVDLRVPVQRNLKVTPYGLARSLSGNAVPDETDTEFGIDVKYSVTESLTLDATLNTDFAQVEADEFQVNLDRFSLFFPEQRPFFLENAGQFSVGTPSEIELFFSRRIGIGPGGVRIPIDYGARLSGKVGGSTNVGLLHMRADALPGVTPVNDFTVARVSQELPNSSSVGALFVNRDGDSSPGADDYNRTYAVDGRLGLGDYTTLSGFVAKTDTPNVSGDDTAWRLAGEYTDRDWSVRGGYTDVQANFNPEVGFLARSDYYKADFFVLRRIRNESWRHMHEIRPHVAYRGFWNHDDYYETGFLHVDSHWEWKSGLEVHTGVNFLHEGVLAPFDIIPGRTVAAGDYDDEEMQLVVMTDEGAPLWFSLSTRLGGLFGGDRRQYVPELRYRFGEVFSSEVSWTRNEIRLPGAADEFEVNLARLRLTWSFTPKMSLQTLVQYSDTTDTLSANVRFAWLTSGDSGFYLVYNETRDDELGLPTERRREIILKFSHTVDLL